MFKGLTSSLRSSSSNESSNSNDLLARKRIDQGQELTWLNLLNAITDNENKKNMSSSKKSVKFPSSRVHPLLRRLLDVANKLDNSDSSPETTKEIAVAIFVKLCPHYADDMPVYKLKPKLKGVFRGAEATDHVATEAMSAVKEITDSFSFPSSHQLDDYLDRLIKKKDRYENNTPFGDSIGFNLTVDPTPLSLIAGSRRVNYDFLDFVDEDKDMGGAGTSTSSHQGVGVATGGGGGEQEQQQSQIIDINWLKARMQENFTHSDIDVTELTRSAFEMLASNKPDDELQTQLFDLLGFDRFEFIGTLLDKRKTILNHTYTKASINLEKERRLTQNPNYCCQVKVQTEVEKQTDKKLLRNQRKFNRRYGNNKQQAAQAQDFEFLDGFDPEKLAAKREAALIKQATSMYSMPIGPVKSTIRYPFVFDASLDAKNSSSFIAGNKMIIPEGATRENTKMYERLDIPPSQAAPTDIGKNKIKIECLDEVGRMAFRNIEELNRLQTVTFATAYSSKENLLICAPTGAGKTNVAMLTIVNEIKSNIDANGMLQKNKFKIVYVAPMKALAAEMVRNFSKKLQPIGITVRECTGDTKLSKDEIEKTQILVVTPEKWDVITRKNTGDVALTSLVRLLIIDEVHLLHDDRGSVIETLVARTLRQVETSQSMIRIVGLSATLPNYIDVARFLNVNPQSGLFFFDGRFRPVPLATSFIGIKALNRIQQMDDYNTVCYDLAMKEVANGHQVMVFVHSRNETLKTARTMCELAKNKGEIGIFHCSPGSGYGEALKSMERSRNKGMRDLFSDGFSIHHAGMDRQDRNHVEKYFADGFIKVLVCTATLAWGVNLPAHAVIIKGTNVYDSKKSQFVDLGILDVQQIFGRAGRPQFDTFGKGIIITNHDRLSHYLTLLTQQEPIESQFIQSITDNLNAEIALGTVATISDATKWLSYTYLYVRMRCNPMVYGIPYQNLEEDPTLEEHRYKLVHSAAFELDKAKMIRYEETTGYLFSTDLGRTASDYYIKFKSVQTFNEIFLPQMGDDKIFEMVSKAQEFEQVRDEELNELDDLLSTCNLPVMGGSENNYGKVNILLQAYITRIPIQSFSLASDTNYIENNAGRIVRALFEIALRKGWPLMTGRLLQLCKIIDRRMWPFASPLRQFPKATISYLILDKLEEKKLSLNNLMEMEATEIGHMINHPRMGAKVKDCVNQLPKISIEAHIQPITRAVIRVKLDITPEFQWSDRVHGFTQHFWIWIEDPDNDHIYHHEYFSLNRRQVNSGEAQQLLFTVPIFEPLPSQYYVRAVNDVWMGSNITVAISFKHLILPERYPPYTDLLPLSPLPITALQEPKFESLYEDKFTYFNPIQTQVFHSLYHTDCNILLGAPTGSGKTIAAELAAFRVFKQYPGAKVVYIAPMKALVKERIKDWKIRFEQKLGIKVVELTGDVTPDMRSIERASVIVTTPEKWDGISRSWNTRSYVKNVRTIIIDEIHLLGNDRGPVLEVIVSRANFIAQKSDFKMRIVGLSTALSNARDLGDWLGITQVGLFNFRPSVRPVPLEVHVNGFHGIHYCPRMQTMNKPTFQAINVHSPEKPVLVFVSSRRQTRLTAIDLISYTAACDSPKKWLHIDEYEGKKKATLLPWKLPNDIKSSIWNHAQIVSINDCLYRHGPYVDHILFLDVDEALHSYTTPAISPLTWIIDHFQANTSAVCFQSAFFDRLDDIGKTPPPQQLRLTAYTQRSPVVEGRTKCAIRPDRVFEMAIHHVSRVTRTKLYSTIVVDSQIENIIIGIKDPNLKLTLAFGIGLHHAGLSERDRLVVEELFVHQKIQILVATSTLAWGVNFPAHLVVIKGTEYYDGKTHRYVDFPITDVLQMMGRAGRPQFDDHGVAVVFVQDVKKQFYKKFLYEPFPVESNLLAVLPEHFNAEIVSGTISTKQEGIDYITWTFLFQRLLLNPSFYGLDDTESSTLNTYLSKLIQRCVNELLNAYCIEFDEEHYKMTPTTLGRIASYYYIHYTTVGTFSVNMSAESTVGDLVKNLAFAYEYNEIPVRHNEDLSNAELAKRLPLPSENFENSNTKAFLLLQAHFSRAQLPTIDYETDLKSVMDQAIRIVQAMLDISINAGWLSTTIRCVQLLQMLIQGRWQDDDCLLQLPCITESNIRNLRYPKGGSHQDNTTIETLPELVDYVYCQENLATRMLKSFLSESQAKKTLEVIKRLPIIQMEVSINGRDEVTRKMTNRRINIKRCPIKQQVFTDVLAEDDYVLKITMRRLTKSKDVKVFSQNYTRSKDEAWVIVVGNVETRDVIAAKRVVSRKHEFSVYLSFTTGKDLGKCIYRVYMLSDSYIGLDQQYDLHLNLKQ